MPKEKYLRGHRTTFASDKIAKQGIDYENRRNQRTSSRKPENKVFNSAFLEAQQLSLELYNTADVWNESRKGTATFSEVIFNKQVNINKFLSARRRIPEIIHRATMVSSNKRNLSLEGFAKGDIYDRQAGGVSMMDIENMRSPLSWDDLESLTRMFGVNKIRGGRNRHSQDKHMLEVLVVFACQNKLDSDGANIPGQLRPLYRNITDFLDYSAGLILDNNLSSEENERFYRWLLKGFPHLPRAMTSYIPASIGISPASTMKVFNQKAEGNGDIMLKLGFKRLKKEISGAWRRGVLPGHLEPYLQYSPDTDNSAQQYIEGYYSRLNDEEKAAVHENQIELVARSNAYFRKIEAQVRRDPSHRLTFKVPANKMVEDVTVTSQDKRTLIFIVKFNDGATHLTLEVTSSGDVYGFPPALAVNNEMAASAFMRDMLTSYLEMVRELHPEVDEEAALQQVILERDVETPIAQEDSQAQEAKSEGRRRIFGKILSPFSHLVRREKHVDMPKRAGLETRQFVVVSSRNQIETTMGGNVKPKTVDSIMQLIKDFEHGRKKSVSLDGIEGQSILYLDGWKIVLSNTGGKYYYLEEISSATR